MSALKEDKLKHVRWLADLMDNKFTIPGTKYTFGLDSIIGLVPYVGDAAGMLVSGTLFTMMVKHGASGKVAVKMLGNIAIDALIGAIPILGDLFDFAFKANRRNVKLLEEHYESGQHKGSAWPYVSLLVIFFILFIAFQIWLAWQVGSWVFSLF